MLKSVMVRNAKEREKEVFHLTAEGYNTTRIASHLSISRRTVETHRASFMRKLGLKTQSDLIRYAIRRGILPLENWLQKSAHCETLLVESAMSPKNMASISQQERQEGSIPSSTRWAHNMHFHTLFVSELYAGTP